MPLYFYKAVDKDGNGKEGTISAVSESVAINSLQQRGYIISAIKSEEEGRGFLAKDLSFFQRVSLKDIVIISRQLSTLFSAQVSALRIFRMISQETENPKLGRALRDVAEDIQGGASISGSLAKHPKIFSSFYISMVRAGEESGRLDETFLFLADYLDRTYEITSKAKNALIYPAFIVFTFFTVMGLMLTLVIPKISAILIESGQDIPIYTKVIIGISNLLVNYGVFVLIGIVAAGFLLVRYSTTESGKRVVDSFKLSIPYVGSLYEKVYLARISDNINTMLASGIPMVKTLELTKDVIDNAVYKDAITEVTNDIQGGSSLSDALEKHEVFPGIVVQLTRVGEETGNLGEILGTLAKFYRREVTNAVDTLVGMIEPIMIVLLSVGVGFLLAAVLIPIYNISSAF